MTNRTVARLLPAWSQGDEAAFVRLAALVFRLPCRPARPQVLPPGCAHSGGCSQPRSAAAGRRSRPRPGTHSDWSSRIAGILNSVDGIYESQLNTGITLTYQQCWTNASTDPYTSTNASTRLSQFRNYWQANRTSVHRDAAHMWTGVDLDGPTVGIAWVAVTCNNPGYSYGLSQDYSPSALAVRLTAHEIGHNLSATHDNETPVCSGVSCSGSGPIMCSSLQSSGSNTFSSCSSSDIDDHIDTYGGNGCLFTQPPSCEPGSTCFSDDECYGGECVKDPEWAIIGECTC